MVNRKINKRMCITKKDEFSFLENDFSFFYKGKSHTIPYQHYIFIFDKFMVTVLQNYAYSNESPFELIAKQDRIEEQEKIKKEFEEFVLKNVKFRKCLHCNEEFLSINRAHRRCDHCTKHISDIVFRPFKMWGDKVI